MAILGQANPNTYRTDNVFTANVGDTIFYCHYDPTVVDVYRNGVKLTGTLDYIANDGVSVQLLTPALQGDVIYVVAHKVNLHHAEFTHAPIVLSSNSSLSSGHQYIYTGSIIMTLPGNPVPGNAIRFYNDSDTATAVIARNGNLIQGINQDLIVDIEDTTLTLIYLDSARGWWVY